MTRRLGRYEVLSELGQGGMGVVLRARSPEGREVAIKILRRGRVGSDSGRFERERRIQSELGESDGFVPVLDSGQSAEGPFVVMPLVEGGTLRDRLDKGVLSVGEVVALGKQLAFALGRAHAHGVVHRDMKPENVLYTSAGLPLVSDLGLAKHFDKASPGASQSVSLSRTGEFHGTAGYMAPEQLDDSKSVGPAADVFSLGAILYEALAGCPAFTGGTVQELLFHVRAGRKQPLAKHRPDAPRWLVAVIERSLALEPRARFALGSDLCRSLEVGPVARRPGRAILALLALALVAGAIVWKRVESAAPPRSTSPTSTSPTSTRAPTSTASTSTSTSPTATSPTPAPARFLSSWGDPRGVHPLGIACAALFPAGDRAITGGPDHTVRVWNLATGEDTQVLTGHEDLVYAVAVLPDGTRALSGGADRTVRLWDLTTGRTRRQLATTSDVRALVLAAAGARAFVAQGDGRIILEDVASQTAIAAWKAHEGPTQSLALSPDGALLASGGADGLVHIWAVEEAGVRPLATLKAHEGSVWALAFARGGEVLVSGGADHTLCFSEVSSGRELRRCHADDEIDSIVALPGEATVFAGGRDHLIGRYTVEQSAPLSQITFAVGRVCSLALVPGGRLLVGDRAGMLRTCTLDGGDVQPPLAGHTGRIYAVACSATGDLVATGGEDATVRVFEAPDGRETARFNDQVNAVYAVALSPDEKTLVTGGWDHALRVHDLASRTVTQSLIVHEGPVFGVAYARDGRSLFSCGGGSRELCLWDTATWSSRVLAEGRPDTNASGVAFAPDGKHVVSGDDEAPIVVWDLVRGWPQATFGPTKAKGVRVRRVSFLAGGREVVLTTNDGQVGTWESGTGRPLRSFAGHDEDEVPGLAVLPDDRRFLTASEDGTVRLWDSKTGECLERIDLRERHDVPISLAASADGRTFVVGTARGVVLRYALEP